MPGKLAARVKGLSEAAFQAAFGTKEQCRAVLGRLRWPKGFLLPGLRPWRPGLAGRAPALPVQPLQAPGPAHGGHDLPCHQAAAHDLVFGRPSDRHGQERHLLGRARPQARGEADHRPCAGCCPRLLRSRIRRLLTADGR